MLLKRYILPVTLLILIVHYVATFNFLYYKFFWLDIPMHILGGLWVGLVFSYVFMKKRKMFVPDKLAVTFLFVVGGTLIIGTFWEFYEFFMSQILPHYVHSMVFGGNDLGDTLGDLLNDMVGGGAAALLLRYKTNLLREDNRV